MITAIVRYRLPAGIPARHGTCPDIEHFETVALSENPGGVVTLPLEPQQ
ncbi:MAG TPA: hypothetical protein VK196_07140 [Magnetospirillum sp.]|nr:hypothetical protein [Magnetospirillum sp.]